MSDITPSTALKLLEALRVAERVLQTVDWLPASIAKVRAAIARAEKELEKDR